MLSFQNANIRICFHSETDFAFKFRVPVSILSQILVPGVEFCQEEVVGLGHGCRLRGFAPVAFHIVLHAGANRWFLPPSFFILSLTCADPAFLSTSFFSLNSTGANCGVSPPSAFMDVVPNCGKSPLSSGCFAIRRGP